MLKEIVVVSGKGGTGKTSIVAALASLLKDKVLGDCDVDAADLHLVLKPQIQEESEFWSGKTAFLNKEKCLDCHKCIELCRFNAIKEDMTIDAVSCEGCGVCAAFCPQGAITLQENLAGHWFISRTPYGPLVHARLGIAEENSGKLVSLVKSKAKKIAAEENKSLILIDGPPGIGCPVIAAISGASLVLIITEPTLSGIHDLSRVVSLIKHFNIKAAACINKADINPEMTAKILADCAAANIPVIGIIPYDSSITKAQILGQSIMDYAPHSNSAQILRNLKEQIIKRINTRSE
ncbi:MAG: 4Fe-4S binding protein [Peptococcaceae bacterium]